MNGLRSNVGKLFLSMLSIIFICSLSGCDSLLHPSLESEYPDHNPVSSSLEANSNEWAEVFFSDPLSKSAKTYHGGPDEELASGIRNARISVDLAAYSLNLWSIRNALIEVHRRGVLVRLVVESDNISTPEIMEIKAAGIPVHSDNREGLMHNKFVIIDRSEVWTGSMNFTINGAYKNNNNLLHIRSSLLAENYLAEFDEMFKEDLFGPLTPMNTPHQRFDLDGIMLETYFAPEDPIGSRLIALIQTAKKNIAFMMYAFTSDEIADALIEASKHGITVAGVVEAGQQTKALGGEYDRLRGAGILVRMDGNDRKMHHKVLIIDDSITITGSYNFSMNAEEVNDENLMIVHSPQVTEWYLMEFDRIFQQAVP